MPLGTRIGNHFVIALTNGCDEVFEALALHSLPINQCDRAIARG